MEDILVTNRIYNGRNNRIIIFNDFDNNDNKIDVISSPGNESCLDNYIYLKEYAKKKFSSDISIMSIVDNDFNFDKYSVLYYLLEEYNVIIFEDLTNDSDLSIKANNKCGIFYFPSNISNEQRDSILSLKKFLKNFNQISFSHIQVDEHHNLSSVPYDFINGNQIDNIESFLPINIEYIKMN